MSLGEKENSRNLFIVLETQLTVKGRYRFLPFKKRHQMCAQILKLINVKLDTRLSVVESDKRKDKANIF